MDAKSRPNSAESAESKMRSKLEQLRMEAEECSTKMAELDSQSSQAIELACERRCILSKWLEALISVSVPTLRVIECNGFKKPAVDLTFPSFYTLSSGHTDRFIGRNVTVEGLTLYIRYDYVLYIPSDHRFDFLCRCNGLKITCTNFKHLNHHVDVRLNASGIRAISASRSFSNQELKQVIASFLKESAIRITYPTALFRLDLSKKLKGHAPNYVIEQFIKLLEEQPQETMFSIKDGAFTYTLSLKDGVNRESGIPAKLVFNDKFSLDIRITPAPYRQYTFKRTCSLKEVPPKTVQFRVFTSELKAKLPTLKDINTAGKFSIKEYR